MEIADPNRLLYACREGYVIEVQRLVPQVRDPADVRNWDRKTLLHYSCLHGWLDVTRKLVEQYQCDPEIRDWGGYTPLQIACGEDHLDIVRYLVSEQGCSTACRNEDGDTPLHVACRDGHADIARYLVSERCSIACQNKNGDTPLHVACCNGHLDIVRYLVSEQGCSTACQNKWYGDTPLHVACRKGRVNIVRYLVSKQKCSTACQNNCGDTPLYVACREQHLAVAEIVLTELNCSTACTSKNKYGNTLLYYSCHHGWYDVTRWLVKQHHCDPEGRNEDGYTPLHEACCNGHLDIVRYLVSIRCNTACQNKDGDTPLHVACQAGHLAMAEILLTGQNCSVACTSKNKDGRTVLHYSCYHGWLVVTRRVVELYHCDPESKDDDGDTPLHKACRNGHVYVVRYLVSEDRCNTACQNKNGDTPLHEACRLGRLAVAEILLTGQNCILACISKNKYGKTVLHYSCHHGWLDMTRRLVEQYHCDPESRDDDGDTPLYEACCKGHVDIVKYLVSEQGCSTACQNRNSDTPLHMACRWNRANIVQFLLSTGTADPWCKNASNHTPVQLSVSYEISKLFAELTKISLVTAIKVFIFGNPATGKSTLVKVIENKVTSRFGILAGQFRNVLGVEQNTAGINTLTIQNSRLGSVTIYDLAGQFEYYSSHDALVGNLMSSSAAIFIVVVKVSESEAEVIQTLQYWISFIDNCCSRMETTAHLMVVGSWADKVRGENIDQKWLNIEKACISSSSPLHFVGFSALDCRKLVSSGLDEICDMIGSSCTDLREAAEQKEIIYPHLLHAFISTKLSGEVACSVRELCTLIRAEDDALLPTEPNLLSALLSSLSDRGHLLYLSNKNNFEAGLVVINKQAVLSEINGTIFAPEHFKQHHDIATSTGVVPKSKIAGVFAEKYNIDMILSVLTLFEFCQKIKDSFTLSLIASSDPSRDIDGASAMTTSDESLESYYFFPALVQVEHPPDVWQNSGAGQYQCGWCLQCSKEGQYLTPRFLHVLLLRLAFSFALAPDSSQQEEASPVLRRRCAIWKNGIQWLDQDGVETIVEVSEQNKLVLLLMLCPEGEEIACVQVRSSLVSKILELKEELCPGISTTELLIDPSNLFNYPLPSSSELTLYTMADQLVKVVREHKQFAVDITGRRKIKLVDALHFEPYLGMHKRLIDQLFDKDLANREVDDCFLHDLAESIHPNLTKEDPNTMKKVLRMFGISDSRLFYSYFEQFPSERDNPVMRCFRLLLTWKNCDTGGSTYQSLRTTLDKYSIFCGRNPVSNQFKQLGDNSLIPRPHPFIRKSSLVSPVKFLMLTYAFPTTIT